MAVNKKALGKAQKEFQKEYKKKIRKHSFKSLVITIAGAAGLAALATQFIFGIYTVTGTAMQPEVKHYVLSNKMAYTLKEPKRGDVILANGEIIRIVALPGDVVEFNGGFIHINGVRLNESSYLDYTKHPVTMYSGNKLTIPENSYYVLSDDRHDISAGKCVTKADIEAKVFWTF